MYEKAAGTYAIGTGVSIQSARADAPPPPTRFSNAAGQLEARVAHLNGTVERIARVADRLGGAVPEEATAVQGNTIRGGGNCVASILENSLDALDGILARAERHVQRLEQL